MGKLAAGTILLVALLAAPAPARAQQVRCDSGATIFVDGPLRIFGVRYRTRDESGHVAYACLGGRGRPVVVGGAGSTTGTASGSTPAYAYTGGRYLATYDVSDGEGGPSASFNVIDVRARRTVVFENLPFDEGVPRFLVAPTGALISGGDALHFHAPGRRDRTLSADDTDVAEIALAGATLYWTEIDGAGVRTARSRTLAGVEGAREAVMLERPRLRPRRPRCEGSGRTIAASPTVAVAERDGARFACRTGGATRFRVGAAGDPRPRIVRDRWVLAQSRDALTVVDTREAEREVIEAGGVTAATMLPDGTVAWLDGAGAVRARRPGEDAVTVLASGGATALAAARRTVYWTSDGTPGATSFASGPG